MGLYYSNHYPSMPIYKHCSLPLIQTGEFDFYRCVQFKNEFYGKTVSELHSGNLRMSSGRYSSLFPGERISYWASDRQTARAEVKKHGANNNLITFFAYDDATSSYPTMSKEKRLLKIIDGKDLGFLELLSKIEQGEVLSAKEVLLLQRIKDNHPDCLAYESEINKDKTNFIFFENGFQKLALRDVRLRLGSEEKISKTKIICATGCDYKPKIKSYGKFFMPKAKVFYNQSYTDSLEYEKRRRIYNYWEQQTFEIENDVLDVAFKIEPITGKILIANADKDENIDI